MAADTMARWNEEARRVADYALREALAVGCNYVGPEHIKAALDRHREREAELRSAAHDKALRALFDAGYQTVNQTALPGGGYRYECFLTSAAARVTR